MAPAYGNDDLCDIVRASVQIPMAGSCRTGIDDITLVAKFQTFYLKLTYDGANDGYRLEGYLYNEEIPKLNLIVPRLHIRTFLSQITEDDYLQISFRINWKIRHDRDKHH